MSFRFHVLGIPHTVSSKEFNACAYTQKIVKFCKMMKERGHYIIHYGHEDSSVICDEHVTVLKNEDFQKSYGSSNWRKNFFKFDNSDHAYQEFYKNAIEEITKRKKTNDFILPFWGFGVKPICDAHNDLIVVEPGIGYAYGHWARWKVFESYAIYHAYCGLQNVGTCNQSWYDVVIPNYFDVDDFEYSDEKEDYFLFLGRVYDGKGVNVAIQATQAAGVKLVIAGQKEDDYNLPSHVDYIGYADVETRKRLMSKARASFLPSMYIEPFGGVQIENLLSGTPTITTDWGSFAENNLHGITGYRCRTMGDFIQAIYNIGRIKPENCRKWGENFSLEKVAPMYEKYFSDVMDIHAGHGWYSEKTSLALSALEKYYPNITNIENNYETLNIKKKINKLKSIRSRNEVKNIYKDLDIKNICEIGVRYGDNFFQMISDDVDNAVGIDIWKVTNIVSQNDLHYTQEELDNQYAEVLNKSKLFGNKIKIIRKFSNEASLDFSDEYFDFIYIDADHTYEAVKKDLNCWWPKLKKGGLMGLHDYENIIHGGLEFGVFKCVNEFLVEKNMQLCNFHLTDGGSMGFKSCYFIKET